MHSSTRVRSVVKCGYCGVELKETSYGRHHMNFHKTLPRYCTKVRIDSKYYFNHVQGREILFM